MYVLEVLSAEQKAEIGKQAEFSVSSLLKNSRCGCAYCIINFMSERGHFYQGSCEII